MTDRRKNWAGNLTYSTHNVFYPKSLKEAQEIVRKCNNLRVLGSRCSFNKIADSIHNQISLEQLNKVVSLDKTNNTITVEGGIKYGELCQYLHENGYALHNLASLPHISIAGACATGSHGSGVKNGNLATAVSEIEFVNAEGDIVVLSREKDGEEFKGAVVGLGSLGVVTKITLDLQPTFYAQQAVYMNLPMKALEHNFVDIVSSGYSVSLFTDWNNKNINQVWIKSRLEKDAPKPLAPEFYGAKLATRNKHPCDDIYAVNCTDQMGVPGPWYERLPHFKMAFKPSLGEELQSEHFVPIEHAYKAIMAIEELHEKINPHLFISEIRTVKGDDLWMSPCYKKDCVAIHFTWKQHWDAVINLISLIEEKLAPFNVRPHWGKLFTMSPKLLQSRFEKIDDFKELLQKHDPKGKFRQEFIDTHLYHGATISLMPTDVLLPSHVVPRPKL